MPQSQVGYNATSIIVHWLTAIFILGLFLTGEGGRDMRALHIGAGVILGIFLLWRIGRRMMRGKAPVPDQHWLLNLLSRIVIAGLLLLIIVSIFSGVFLPWTRGSALNIFDLVSIPSPMALNRDLHEAMEEVHEIFSHLFIPLTALHVLGTLKHYFIDKDDVARRMFVPQKSGK